MDFPGNTHTHYNGTEREQKKSREKSSKHRRNTNVAYKVNTCKQPCSNNKAMEKNTCF